MKAGNIWQAFKVFSTVEDMLLSEVNVIMLYFN